MVYYRASVEPYYEGNNRGFYAYEGRVHAISTSDREWKLVWVVIEKRRRDAKAKAEQAAKRLTLDDSAKLNSNSKIDLLKWEKHERPNAGLVTKAGRGMTGRHHSLETRARIAQALRDRWAAGAYADAKVGAKSALERKQREVERAEHEQRMVEVLKKRRLDARSLPKR